MAALAFVPIAVILAALATAGAAERPTRRVAGEFEATAYSIEGQTADGTRARPGVVAADPDLLPLGSRIRIEGAGRYDGEYVVEDTGRSIRGREIDIYLRSDAEAKRFGRKQVRVEVLERGEGRDGRPEAPRSRAGGTGNGA
jgi:3D (Asp-Asp-Asp) domain-containing protein